MNPLDQDMKFSGLDNSGSQGFLPGEHIPNLPPGMPSTPRTRTPAVINPPKYFSAPPPRQQHQLASAPAGSVPSPPRPEPHYFQFPQNQNYMIQDTTVPGPFNSMSDPSTGRPLKLKPASERQPVMRFDPMTGRWM